MSEEQRNDLLAHKRKMIVARLQPANAFEDHLVRQIVFCSYRLEQLEQRLTKAWALLNKVHEEVR